MSDDSAPFDFSSGDSGGSNTYFFDSSSGSGGGCLGTIVVLSAFAAVALVVTACMADTKPNIQAAAVDACVAGQPQNSSFGHLFNYRFFSDPPDSSHHVKIEDGHVVVTQITGSKTYYGEGVGTRYFTNNFGFNLNDKTALDTFGEGHIDS